MTTTIKKRARDESSKQARKETILEAALSLFQGGSLLPKVDEIALKAGLAKGTVYLYFESREEIYLHLVTMHVTAYWENLEAHLRASPSLTPEELARWILDYHDTHPHYLPMASILNHILEENAGLSETVNFKHLHAQKLSDCGKLLDATVAGLPLGEGVHLLLALNALMVGLWERANPTRAVRDLLELLELNSLQINFTKEAERSVVALCKGYSTAALNP